MSMALCSYILHEYDRGVGEVTSLRDIVGQRMIAARLMDALNAMNIKYRILEDAEATLITVTYNQLRAEFDKSDLKKEGKDFSEFLDTLLNSIAIKSGLNTEIYRYLIKENDGWTFEIPRWVYERSRP
jgi:hypothetical protein